MFVECALDYSTAHFMLSCLVNSSIILRKESLQFGQRGGIGAQVADDSPPVQHHNAVTDVGDVAEVVARDEQRGPVFFGHRPQQVFQANLGGGVQVSKRVR